MLGISFYVTVQSLMFLQCLRIDAQKMVLNISISDCSNDSTIYISNEKEAAELLYFQAEVVFSSIIVPCMMVVSFLSNSAFILHCL